MKTPFRQFLADARAHARAVRWGVVLTQISVALGVVAAAADYTHYLPARWAAPASAACLVCAGLGPKMRQAAGIVAQIQDGQLPLLAGVAQAWKAFVSERQRQALLRKAASLSPAIVEALKTIQGGLDAASLAAGHEALKQTEDLKQSNAAAAATDPADVLPNSLTPSANAEMVADLSGSFAANASTENKSTEGKTE